MRRTRQRLAPRFLMVAMVLAGLGGLAWWLGQDLADFRSDPGDATPFVGREGPATSKAGTAVPEGRATPDAPDSVSVPTLVGQEPTALAPRPVDEFLGTGALEGVVRELNGDPVPSAMVIASMGLVRERTIADLEGRYRFDVLTGGTWEMWIAPESVEGFLSPRVGADAYPRKRFPAWARAKTVVVGREGVARCDPVVVRPARLEGRVLGRYGTGAPGRVVRVRARESILSKGAGFSDVTTSDAMGRFVFERLAPVTSLLRVEATEDAKLNPNEMRVVQLEPGTTHQVTVSHGSDLSVRGRVLDAWTGRAVRGRRIEVRTTEPGGSGWGDGRHVMEAWTDDAGRYILSLFEGQDARVRFTPESEHGQGAGRSGLAGAVDDWVYDPARGFGRLASESGGQVTTWQAVDQGRVTLPDIQVWPSRPFVVTGLLTHADGRAASARLEVRTASADGLPSLPAPSLVLEDLPDEPFTTAADGSFEWQCEAPRPALELTATVGDWSETRRFMPEPGGRVDLVFSVP